jgi:hypothetical protein
MNKQWWQKKKVWGTILSCAVYLIGAREGWEPETTHGIAGCLMGGVTIEGVIDALALFRRN